MINMYIFIKYITYHSMRLILVSYTPCWQLWWFLALKQFSYFSYSQIIFCGSEIFNLSMITSLVWNKVDTYQRKIHATFYVNKVFCSTIICNLKHEDDLNLCQISMKLNERPQYQMLINADKLLNHVGHFCLGFNMFILVRFTKPLTILGQSY